MNRQRFSECIVILVLLGGCSREQPSGAADSQPAEKPAETRRAESPPLHYLSYADAMTWLASTPGFRFVLDEQGIHAVGDMTRPRIGAERVRFNVNGEEWTAEAGASGIRWSRGQQPSDAPAWGGRFYQRVTLAIDPQKAEGEAKLVEPGHYRFTNANDGEVHDVWVTDKSLSRIRIGNKMDLTITP